MQIHLLRLGPQTGRGRRSLAKHHHEAEGREERVEPGRGRDSRVVVVHGTKTSGEVTGLRLFSRYELSITAFNSKGEGPHSTPHHFRTPEGGECLSILPGPRPGEGPLEPRVHLQPIRAATARQI